MSSSAASSSPGSANASPARPRSVAITSAVPNGEGWNPYRIVRPWPPDFHSPGDIASWVTKRSCRRPGAKYLFRDGAGRAAARLRQGRGKRQRESFLLARPEETGNRQPPPMRDQEQALDAEFLVGLAIEPDPDRVELPFGDGSAV